MPFIKNESAVSETIGTVLVVALTVIMAALIAAFLFGAFNGVQPTRAIAVTAEQPDATHVFVVYHGGPDQGSLQNLTILWPTGPATLVDFPAVGTTYMNPPTFTPTGGRDHIIVTGIFVNNVKQVVLDTYV